MPYYVDLLAQLSFPSSTYKVNKSLYLLPCRLLLSLQIRVKSLPTSFLTPTATTFCELIDFRPPSLLLFLAAFLFRLFFFFLSFCPTVMLTQFI